jgi:hypothetical protein
MKTLVAIMTLISLNVASADCLREAQIIAKVETSTKTSMNSCLVTVAADTVRHYSASRLCPLDLNDIIQAGIEVEMNDDQTCAYEVGQDISGVVVQNNDGSVSLD